METLYRKGHYKGECNRTACKNSNAIFYNHSTHKYYCGQCDYEINQWAQDFKKETGHELCVKVEVIDLPKPYMTPIQSDQTQIEKLEAEMKELLEALEKTNTAIMDCDWSENEGSPHLIPIYESNQSLIQKHKQ